MRRHIRLNLGVGESAGVDANLIDAALENAVEGEISALLNDKTRPLPADFRGKDPREVRGKDDDEFIRRMLVLRDWLREHLSKEPRANNGTTRAGRS